MRKNLFFILFFLVILILVALVFFSFRERIAEGNVLELRSEVIEEGLEYTLSGLLIENRIIEDRYLILRVDMNRFFIGSPVPVKEIKILVPESTEVVTKDIETGEIVASITADDLEILDQIDLTVDIPIIFILGNPRFIAHSQIGKLIKPSEIDIRQGIVETISDEE